MRAAVVTVLVTAAAVPAAAIRIDISAQDVERALVVARSRDVERAKFHAPYITQVDTPFVERAELVSEFRRVVLLAEDRASKGDRYFGYSITRAHDAVKVWRRRVSVIAHVRFHPQNNYISVPPVDISLEGDRDALIGVLHQPVLSLGTARKDETLPILGATVEGVFDADALGQQRRTFVVSLDGKELGRVTFDLAALE